MILAFAVPPLLWNINWKMYMIFATFNGLSFIHMTLLAPETRGFTLEEMDDVFDSGRPAWKSYKKESRLDKLQKEIEDGKLKIDVGHKQTPTTVENVPAAEEKTV